LFTVEHYVDAARAEGLDIATWEVSREHAFAVMDRPPTPRQSDAHPGAQTTSSQTCVLQGVIDRLVIGRDADGVVRFAEVLDFKTDSGRDEGQAAIEDKIRRRYTEQMRAYCRAVSRLYHIPVDSIRVKLLVIEHGLIVPVPHQHS